MPNQSQLSPRGAMLGGLLFTCVSGVPILSGLGLIRLRPTAGTPGWIAVCAGLAFLFGGGAMFVIAASGGTGPNGEPVRPLSPAFRRVQSTMVLGIVGSFAAISSWIAFGPGERHFSSAVAVPFVTIRMPSGETTGRWAFGIGAVILWFVISGMLIAYARRRIASITNRVSR